MDVVVDGVIFRSISLPSICLMRRFLSVRRKQVALLFQISLLSGVGFCNLHRVCCLVRAIITDYGAETLIRDGRSLINITEQLHWKSPATYTNELQVCFLGARLEAFHRQCDQVEHASASLVAALLAADLRRQRVKWEHFCGRLEEDGTTLLLRCSVMSACLLLRSGD